MNRVLLLILGMFAFSVCTWGQTVDISKLKEKANQSDNPELYNQLATQLLPKDVKEAKEYALTALELSTSSANVEQQAVANELLGKVAKEHFDYTNAIRYYLEAQNHWRSIDNKLGIAR